MAQRRRNAVLAVVELIRRHEPRVTLVHLVAFLYVCENEGLNVSELADVCGATRATASRIARALAAPDAPGGLKPFLGLVDIRDNPSDVRGRIIFLSPAGKRLRDAMDALIAEATPICPPGQARRISPA